MEQSAKPEEVEMWKCEKCNKTIRLVSKWAHINYVHEKKKRVHKKRKVDTEDTDEDDDKQLRNVVKDFLLRDCVACEHYACKATCPMKSFRDCLRSALQHH
jgi:Fe-S-cluster-containing dehydrogenase component